MIIHFIMRVPSRQRGAVLIISLLILMVITLIGITAMQTTTLDTKIAANYKNYKISFEGAEAALTEAQSRLGIPRDLEGFSRPRMGDNNQKNNPKIWNLNPAKPNDCDKGSNNNDPWWFQWDWACWKEYAIEYSDTIYIQQTSSGKTAIKPFYLIEYQAQSKEPLNWGSYEDPQAIKDYYRITSRGSTDQNGQSDVILQSVFAWRYRDD